MGRGDDSCEGTAHTQGTDYLHNELLGCELSSPENCKPMSEPTEVLAGAVHATPTCHALPVSCGWCVAGSEKYRKGARAQGGGQPAFQGGQLPESDGRLPPSGCMHHRRAMRGCALARGLPSADPCTCRGSLAPCRYSCMCMATRLLRAAVVVLVLLRRWAGRRRL